MNKGKLTIVFVLLSLLALSWGCSGSGNGSGVLPEAQPPTQEMRTGTGSWGTYQVTINANTKEVDITMLRQADLILNVLGFMEPPPLQSMNIDWDTLFIDDENSYIGVDVILTHPIPGDPVFKGFDVRAICFGPELLNADGYTILMNPADFEGVPFGYMDGLLGTPNSVANYDDVWGYKYFCDDLGQDDDLATFFSDEDNLANRGVFSEGATNRRHYDLSWQESDVVFYMFNYAIYANYNWPVGDPPFTIDSFQITSANSQEAFLAIGLEPTVNTLYYDEESDPTGGGMVTLDVEVWDWQGAVSQTVTIESIEAGVIAQTSSDSDSAGSTSKSWIHTFTDVPAVPTTTADLDILITVTDPDVTFGQAWFFELLDPGHSMYDDNVWCAFMTSVPVSDEGPATGDGMTLIDSGDLPDTLPFTDAKELCVVGNDSFGKAGVYFYGPSYQIHYYPLDYSADSSIYMTLQGGFGYPMSAWLGAPNEPNSLAIDATGGLLCTTDSSNVFFSGYLANQCTTWWSANNPSGQNALVLTASWGTVRTRDASSEFDGMGILWASYAVELDLAGSVEIIHNGVAFPYGSDYYNPPFGGMWGINWGPLDETPAGSLDGEVSDVEQTRFTVDSAPEGLNAGQNIIFYYLESAPDTNAIEVMANLKLADSGMHLSLGTIKDFVGTAIDMDAWYTYENIDDAETNWLVVLEDNGDNTWQLAIFDQDGTLIDRSDAVSSTPLWVDCDNTNTQVHVWGDDAGTLKYYIFEWA